MSDEYNGWPNYETWAVKVWLDNDEGSQAYWQEQASRYGKAAPFAPTVDDGTYTAEDWARIGLADMLRDELDEAMPEVNGMWADLLNSAFRRVDWNEIARVLLSEN
jgi:hypothetical protein